MPLGMHGYRLEVETHIITAAAASVENLRQCVAGSGWRYPSLCSTRWLRQRWC
jgi:cell division ATPase FtsA